MTIMSSAGYEINFIVSLDLMRDSGNAGIVSKMSVIRAGARNLDLNSLSGLHTPTSSRWLTECP